MSLFSCTDLSSGEFYASWNRASSAWSTGTLYSYMRALHVNMRALYVDMIALHIWSSYDNPLSMGREFRHPQAIVFPSHNYP